MPGRYPDDNDEDEDEEDDSDGDGDRSEGGWEDDEVDTDVLPTLLVYRAGELVHSWVRVDWEANMGVEELLRRCVSCAVFYQTLRPLTLLLLLLLKKTPHSRGGRRIRRKLWSAL